MSPPIIRIEATGRGMVLVTNTLELAEIEAAMIRYALTHADTLESAAAALRLTPAALRRRAARHKITLPSPRR